MWQDFIALHARTRAGQLALLDRQSGRSFTYAELHAEINRLADLLWRLGVRDDDRVVLLAPSRVEHITLFFACIRIGAILAPLNHRLADQEIAAILADLEPKCLLGERPGFIGLDTLNQDAPPRPLPERTIPLEQVLMILYTSGSSGTPKGVMFHAGMIRANIDNTLSADVLRADDVSIVNTPFFHTGGYHVFCLPMLCVGGTLILHERFDAGWVLEEIREAGVTVFWAVPTMFQAMFDHADFARTDFSRIRFLLSGGAPLSLALIQGYHQRGVPFKQGFGLTEVGPNCFLLQTCEAPLHPDSIGRPMKNSDVRVVDERGNPVAPGEVGEMWIAGPHVCKGYWRHAALFAAAMHEGHFATGDLVRVDAEGLFYVIGRKKELYISGGENVYPGEVERQLASHPHVVQAVVVGVPDAKWGEVGLAWCVIRAPLDLVGIRAYLDPRLARYKHPLHVRILEAMPLLANGKIDRPILKRWGLEIFSKKD
ncbi:Long-chain-fatty-acid--CoA ligase [Candidatus Magnetaquicoccaceae bacterium FCR-1]|uniref:Long-chain-fatty-acid--CoA ligase n=1 Tax=Candidatus Magnetaquiglobus chichijimensis TaxID=3141448 RepID=A0ABQ0C8U4_9PROT